MRWSGKTVKCLVFILTPEMVQLNMAAPSSTKLIIILPTTALTIPNPALQVCSGEV
jgi:hypothetical protein